MTRRIPASRVVAIACLFAGCATHESSAPLVSQTPADGVEAAGVAPSNLDPASRGYLAGLRQAIAAKLFHPPCEGEWWKSLLWCCDYKTTRVVVEISILRDGQVRSVTVREPSEYAAYNDAAIRAPGRGAVPADSRHHVRAKARHHLSASNRVRGIEAPLRPDRTRGASSDAMTREVLGPPV